VPSGTSAPAAPSQESGAATSSDKIGDIAKTLAAEDEVLSARAKGLTTVDAAFAYLRDRIGFESYDGILRGAATTFHTRAGNALDRALLLEAILASHKVPVRLVTGRLPPASAERLLTRLFEPPANPSRPAARPVPPDAAALRDRIIARARHDEHVVLTALGPSLP